MHVLHWQHCCLYPFMFATLVVQGFNQLMIFILQATFATMDLENLWDRLSLMCFAPCTEVYEHYTMIYIACEQVCTWLHIRDIANKARQHNINWDGSLSRLFKEEAMSLPRRQMLFSFLVSATSHCKLIQWLKFSTHKNSHLKVYMNNHVHSTPQSKKEENKERKKNHTHVCTCCNLKFCNCKTKNKILINNNKASQPAKNCVSHPIPMYAKEGTYMYTQPPH